MPYASLNNIKLFYEVKGRCTGIPLVMVPGLGGDILTFSYSANMLSRFFPVVLMENIGVGRSSVPEPPYTTDDMSEHLKQLVDFLGYSKINLLGHSMGGYVSQKFTLRYPSIVNRLILSGTAVKMSDNVKIKFSELYEIRAISKVSMRGFYGVMLKALVSKSFYENTGTREALLDLMENIPHQQTLDGFKGQLTACLCHDTSKEIQNIRSKTLVMTGLLDKIALPHDAEFLSKKIKDSELELINGVAHLPQLEDPDRYTDIILRFIDGVK